MQLCDFLKGKKCYDPAGVIPWPITALLKSPEWRVVAQLNYESREMRIYFDEGRSFEEME